MPDYHLHTPYCRHAQGGMELYARQAASLGLEEICFTPHMPMPGFGRGPDWLRMAGEDMERYLRDLENVRARHRELTILCGIEADFYDGYEKQVEELLARYPFELVLMSVHFLREWIGARDIGWRAAAVTSSFGLHYSSFIIAVGAEGDIGNDGYWFH